MENKKLLTLYEERYKDFNKLRNRMKKDKKRYELEKYYLKGFDGKKLPKVVSTTLNDPRTFGRRSVAILSSADPQIVVDSEEMKTDIEITIENFLSMVESEGDRRLGNQIREASFPFLCEQSCIRGWLVGASFFREENGKLVADRRPIEAMDMAYDADVDGLVWAGYTRQRTQAAIEAEYNTKIPTKAGYVTVIFDREKMEVYVDRNLVKSEAHPYIWNGQGYVPFVIRPVNYDNELEYTGESIYEMNREMYDKMNEMASVLENLTMASYFNAMQYASELGEQGEPPDVNPYELGQVASVEKGGGFFAMPINDIRNATRLLYSIYENRIQRGSLPNIDYGNLTFPLSGAAINRLTESKDMIFTPRLHALAKFYQAWDMMAIRQYLTINKKLEVGDNDERRSFAPSELEGKYTILRKYYAVSPDQDLANTSLGQVQQMMGMPMEYIVRQTLKVKDPDMVMSQIKSEQAAKTNPLVGMLEQVHALIDEDKPIQAELVLQQLEAMYSQNAANQAMTQAPGQSIQAPSTEPIIPLFGNGGGGGRPPKSEQDRAEEEMNEEETVNRLAETAREGRRNQA